MVQIEGAALAEKEQSVVLRLRQLDALRGLAALSVVLQHCFYVFPLLFNDTTGQPSLWLLNLFKYSPLHLFWAGTQAVFLFFLLSGFVLSLPFYTTQAPSYPVFLLKRICRLYLPYIAALAIAILADNCFSRHGIVTLSDWFNSIWSEAPSKSLAIQHVILIDHFDTKGINPVIWSLVQEMRVSLLFPLLMMLVNRYHWPFLLGMALVLFSAGELTHVLYDGATTLEVVAFFLVGALLAKYQKRLVDCYQKRPIWFQPLLFGGALLAYTAPWWLFPVKALSALPIIADALCVFGGVLLLFLALASRRLIRFLCWSPLLFLVQFHQRW